jgi:hypothetical protein
VKIRILRALPDCNPVVNNPLDALSEKSLFVVKIVLSQPAVNLT